MRVWQFAAASVALHAVVLALWLFAPTSTATPAIDLDRVVVKARLVKLGTPRDETLLPKIDTSAPSQKAPQKPTSVDDKTPPKPTPDSTQKPASTTDVLKQFAENAAPKDINDLIQKRIGDPDDDGQKDGDKDGSALTGEHTDSYFARVAAKIQKAMQVSSVLSDEERVRLKAVLCFTIAEDGALADVEMKTSSGSVVYDNDVVSAARRAAPMPAPPVDVRPQAAQSNCLNFCPNRCK
jgi:periplasmic protein TonB